MLSLSIHLHNFDVKLFFMTTLKKIEHSMTDDVKIW